AGCCGLAGTTITREARAYNKVVMRPDGTGTNVRDALGRLMNASFFRMRGGLNTFDGTDPAPCFGLDNASQVGCLTTSQSCDIGATALAALPAGSLSALAIQGTGGGLGLYPTGTNIVNL